MHFYWPSPPQAPITASRTHLGKHAIYWWRPATLQKQRTHSSLVNTETFSQAPPPCLLLRCALQERSRLEKARRKTQDAGRNSVNSLQTDFDHPHARLARAQVSWAPLVIWVPVPTVAVPQTRTISACFPLADHEPRSIV